jgi:hypothetical protein
MNSFGEYVSRTQEEFIKPLENQKQFGNFIKRRNLPLVRLQCPGPRSIEESPPVNERVEGGNPPYFPEEVLGLYTNGVEG